MKRVARFENLVVASGSARGRAHRRAFRNNQDAACVTACEAGLVGVVADGCGSGSSSEVGAQLAARWIASRAPSLLRHCGATAAFADELLVGLERAMVGWLEGLATDDDEALSTLTDAFLFTVLGLAVDATRACVFAVGDGLVVHDGKARLLESGPGNAPAYLGYRLLPPRSAPPAPTVVVAELRKGDVRSLLLGTDGVASLLPEGAAGAPGPELADLCEDPRYVKHPMLVQRRLCALGMKDRRLEDDATLVLVRRVEP